VINASLAGVIAEARASGRYGRILGMRSGIQGALEGRLAELTDLSPAQLDGLRRTPSAALGSCRYKLKSGDADRLLELCRGEQVQTFVYIGGNDSADTAHQVGERALAIGMGSFGVVGVPKTVDNDLPHMDHCPGYGSAARFVAQTTREASLDTWAMRSTDPIKLVEVMGRDAGWLAASGWLGRAEPGSAPHLVLVPERPLPYERIASAVADVYQREGWCVMIVCENQPDPAGHVLGASGEPRWVDAFGHAYYDSPAAWLARELQHSLRVRVRVDRPGTIQRMAGAYVSPVDRAEAELVGRAAVRYAVAGVSDVMVTLEREPGEEYRIRTGAAPLAEVANQQRRLPDGYILPDGMGLSEAFDAYARPLLGPPLPEVLSFRA
jgi:6-phosphofructokinase 1